MAVLGSMRRGRKRDWHRRRRPYKSAEQFLDLTYRDARFSQRKEIGDIVGSPVILVGIHGLRHSIEILRINVHPRALSIPLASLGTINRKF